MEHPIEAMGARAAVRPRSVPVAGSAGRRSNSAHAEHLEFAVTDMPMDGTEHRPRIRDERVVLRRRLKHREDRIADGATAFSGSMAFVYLHTAWFAVWLLLNLGVFGSAAVFDPFPFGLLTLIVSLEAIFLSTFVLISQNRQALRADVRSELDYETNVRSEIWSRAIADRIGVDPDEVEQRIRSVIDTDREKLREAQAD
jgi:uncharacterized membrane protein